MASIAEQVQYGGRLAILSRARIPLFRIERKHDGLDDTNYGEEGVLTNLKESKGVIIFSTDRHALVSLPSLSPHHPKGNNILWTAELNEDGKFKNWSENSWLNLAQDHEYVSGLQEELIKRAKKNETTYLYFGYTDGKEHINKSYAYHRGSQSVRPPHVHYLNEPFDNEAADNFLNLFGAKTEKDIQKLVFFANIAGEAAIANWDKVLNDFSNNRINYQQPLTGENGKNLRYPRTFFGFSSLQDALNQIILLETEVKSTWDNFCQEIFRSSPPYLRKDIGKLFNFFKQSAAINAAIMIPTEQDKINGRVEADDSLIWVAPFTIGNVLQMLKGIHVDRNQ